MPDANTMQKRRSWVPVLLLLLVGAGLWVYKTSPPRRPFVQPHIKAAPFDWPKGCAPANYGLLYKSKKMDSISKNCAVDENIISKDITYQYGFIYRGRGEKKYYRVGNDALLLQCDIVVNYINNACAINYVILHAYYQEVK